MPSLSFDVTTFLLSWGNLYKPNKYKDKEKEINTHIPIKTSLLSIPQCSTKSALDKNLNAKPNSKKPKITLKVFIHLPDLGRVVSKFGNKAKIVNGKAKATPKPNIPMVNWIAPPWDEIEPTNKEPKIGPVQENDTSTKVNAIKKTPMYPPIELDFESIELTHLEGIVIS